MQQLVSAKQEINCLLSGSVIMCTKTHSEHISRQQESLMEQMGPADLKTIREGKACFAVKLHELPSVRTLSAFAVVGPKRHTFLLEHLNSENFTPYIEDTPFLVNVAVLMPMTRPAESSSGPPELPVQPGAMDADRPMITIQIGTGTVTDTAF